MDVLVAWWYDPHSHYWWVRELTRGTHLWWRDMFGNATSRACEVVVLRAFHATYAWHMVAGTLCTTSLITLACDIAPLSVHVVAVQKTASMLCGPTLLVACDGLAASFVYFDALEKSDRHSPQCHHTELSPREIPLSTQRRCAFPSAIENVSPI
jgi:hypothetical protein